MPLRAVARARLAAIVLLPTPPLALLTTTAFLTLSIGLFSGSPAYVFALAAWQRLFIGMQKTHLVSSAPPS